MPELDAKDRDNLRSSQFAYVDKDDYASAIPLLLATMRNSRQAYRFEWGMTPENRERAYLIELLTRRAS